MDDRTRYRQALQAVEREAVELPWADGRPWRVETHVWFESNLAVVDLHDLSAALARQVVRTVVSHPSDTGAVVFVHGHGTRLGASQVLRHLVRRELRSACDDHPGWTWRQSGGGRTIWISDPARAPAQATGDWGLGTQALFLALGAAAVVGLLNALGWL